MSVFRAIAIKVNTRHYDGRFCSKEVLEELAKDNPNFEIDDNGNLVGLSCTHTNIDYDLTMAVLDCIPQQIWGKCRDCGEERYFDDKHIEFFY